MFQGPLKSANEEERCAYVLIWVGETGGDIFTSWNLSGADSKKIDIIYQKFSEHLSPKKNKLFYRYIFHERKQQPGELFETFVTDLRNLVKDCEYNNPDEMVRDRIVSGVTSQETREKLLTEGDDLSLAKAIDITMMYEVTKKQLASMAASAGNNEGTNSTPTMDQSQHQCQTSTPAGTAEASTGRKNAQPLARHAPTAGS